MTSTCPTQFQGLLAASPSPPWKSMPQCKGRSLAENLDEPPLVFVFPII